MVDPILSRQPLSRQQRVDHPERARLLSNMTARRYLQPFLGQALSVSEAAARVSATVQVMHYWTKRLYDHNLLDITHEQTRRGRAIKYYQAVAESFFVPFAATPTDSLESFLREYDSVQQAHFERGIVKAFLEGIDDPLAWGLKVRAGEHCALEWGREDSTASCPLLEAMQQAWAPPIFDSWQALELDFEAATKLQAELWALWTKYEARKTTSKTSQPYLLRLGLAPTS